MPAAAKEQNFATSIIIQAMERYMVVLKSIRRMYPELEQVLHDNVYPVSLQKGETLQEPGTLRNNIYFIEKGLLHYFCLAKDRKVTLGFRGEDEFVVTLEDAFPDGDGNGIEALEDCILWCIPGKLVDELHAKHLLFSYHSLHILARETMAIKDFYMCVYPGGGAPNLDNFRELFPELVHRVPIEWLANLTNIPELKLKHLLESPIKLNTGSTAKRRRAQRGKI